jgi:hypothetical protein
LVVLVVVALAIQISAAVAQGASGLDLGPLGPDSAWATNDDDDNNDHDDDNNDHDDDDDDDHDDDDDNEDDD